MGLLSVLGKIAGGPIGLVTDIAGGVINNRARNKATKAQTDAIAKAQGILRQGQTDAVGANVAGQGQILQTLQPWQQGGLDAFNSLQGLLADNVDPFKYDASTTQADPGFEFVMREAMKGLSRSAAGRMRLHSGDTYKELLRYGTDLASTEYAAADARNFRNQSTAYQSMIENQARRQAGLQNLANTGFSAATQGNQATQNMTNNLTDLYGTTARNIAGLTTDAGAVNASGYISGANNLNNLLGNIGSGLGGLVGGSNPGRHPVDDIYT